MARRSLHPSGGDRSGLQGQHFGTARLNAFGDGTKQGFALDITRTLSTTLPVPVIASGGGGTMQHFVDVFENAKADAALAASIFHFKEITIHDLKAWLSENNIPVRK